MSYNKEKQCWEGFIYCITNKLNNKQYIGQTATTIKHRMGQHFSNTKQSEQLIKKAIKKYGKDNFDIEVVEKITAQNKKELTLVVELGWISKLLCCVKKIVSNIYLHEIPLA